MNYRHPRNELKNFVDKRPKRMGTDTLNMHFSGHFQILATFQRSQTRLYGASFLFVADVLSEHLSNEFTSHGRLCTDQLEVVSDMQLSHAHTDVVKS